MLLKITTEKLPELLTFIASKQQLYVPQKKASKLNFSLWQEGTEVDLSGLLTTKSAKDIFFPQSETLVKFTACGQKLSIEPAAAECQDFVLFGVKPCDAKSFELLDKVFLSEPVDSFYQNKREHGVIISLACNEPEETCFCGLFGIDAVTPAADIAIWQVENQLFWLNQSDKGQKLTQSLEEFLTTANANDEKKLAEQKNQTASILAQLPLWEFKLPDFAGQSQDKVFNSNLWGQISQTCLGCGTCTYVCPTCHCYDIGDFDAGNNIERFRCWDSCMDSDFTNMAHGNPRKSQLERFRQRFMHKLIYYPKNNEGAYACVGCGRCLNICPINMNIAKVIKGLEANNNV